MNVTPGNVSAYSEMRPRLTFFRSMTHASFSRSIPAGSWITPPESDRVIGLAPKSSSFSTAYWATLPLPETRLTLPSRVSCRVCSISSAKYTAP